MAAILYHEPLGPHRAGKALACGSNHHGTRHATRDRFA
jgi:hypothetical protein